HDQLEAMQMGDKIVVMNHGVVEQFGVPQEIYDWPATKFVAEFIGSPSMNFLNFHGMVGKGMNSVDLGETSFEMPKLLDGANGDLLFGVRPEHVKLDDSASYKGRVTTTEYLGTTQIVTFDTPNGSIKARLESNKNINVGETVGLRFDPRTVTIFDTNTGHALLSEANEGVLNHG
ncbi:MAG: ABC transporter ATP-binding protein, partial [Rhodobacteraceae bacterium]|nr:ABC transporter ATP-binding protein [Paracoccaceae bacterium]